MFKITTGSSSIQKVIDVLEPHHFIFDKGFLYVVLYTDLDGILQKIKKKRLSNIFVEEITELNLKSQPDFIQQEFTNMQIQNDCIKFEIEEQIKLKDIRKKLIHWSELLDKIKEGGD